MGRILRELFGLALIAVLAPTSHAASSVAGTSPSAGQVSDRGYVLSIGARADDDNDVGLFGALNYRIARSTWLFFDAGFTHAEDSQSEINSRAFGAGVDHEFGKTGVTADLQFWGEPDEFVRTGLGASWYYKEGPWRFSLLGQYRELEIALRLQTDVIDFQRDFELNSPGYGVAMSYTQPRWSVYLRGMSYDYSRDPSALDSRIALEFLSASALTLASSLLDRRASVGAEYRFGLQAINLLIGRDRSAIDNALSTSIDFDWTIPVGRSTDLTLNAGRTDTEGFDTAFVFGFLVSFYRL